MLPLAGTYFLWCPVTKCTTTRRSCAIDSIGTATYSSRILSHVRHLTPLSTISTSKWVAAAGHSLRIMHGIWSATAVSRSAYRTPPRAYFRPPRITYADSFRAAVSGTSVMALVRQVFGEPVRVWDVQTLHLAAPHESFGMRLPNVFMGRGTKLALVALTPLHDIPMHMGTPVVVKSSNSSDTYAALRSTYGQHDMESGDIHGDGCYTNDPAELLPLGKQHGVDEVTGRSVVVDVNPFLSAAMEQGDILLLTLYTMHSFLTNTTAYWRVIAETVWTMESDEVGPDPRYVGDDAVGLREWHANRDNRKMYPRSMQEAKKAWGLLPKAPPSP
uniref:Uncharacterized protein TCIL3000_10_610 n=1 Tax=Trypanosoma congolense (strain IL3000) TaxID=1068625 RepID=G0UV87_TRYCI|nr:unnamed protein product [Trypanosoma congolense IL3000]